MSEETPTTDPQTPDTGQAGDPPQPTEEPQGTQDAPLGEAGLKALQAEREARQQLEKQLKALSPLQKLAEALGGGDADQGTTELEQLSERLASHEKELSEERTARWRAEVAHEKGLTAQQAARLVGSTRDELASDADELLKLFPKPDQGKRFQGSGDGGPRPSGQKPSQLTRDDLKRMSPEQIVKAKAEGLLNDLFASKN